MTEFADLFAQPAAVEWIIGKVDRITGTTFTMQYKGGLVEGVGSLDQYTPKVGDIVHCLSLEGQGVLALGSNNQKTTPDPPEETITAVVLPLSSMGWLALDHIWVMDPPLVQTPDQAIVWEYPPDGLDDQKWTDLGTLEIELTGLAGEQAELHLHNNTGTGEDFSEQQTWTTDPLPVNNTPTWMALPLGWGAELTQGRSRGIALGLTTEGTTNFTGTGRLRFTSIPGPSS